MAEKPEIAIQGVVAVYESIGNYYLQKERLEHQFFIGYIVALALVFWAFYGVSGNLDALKVLEPTLSLTKWLLWVVFLAFAYWLYRIQRSQSIVQEQLDKLRNVVLDDYENGMSASECFHRHRHRRGKPVYWSYPVYVGIAAALTFLLFKLTEQLRLAAGQ